MSKTLGNVPSSAALSEESHCLPASSADSVHRALRISVFGLGYVGCVGMSCLAHSGHRVIGVDPQPMKVEFINQGKPTIIEPGIEEILAAQHAAGRITATCDGQKAVAESELTFICVGTPSTDNGHLDLGAVMKVAEQIAQALKLKPTRHVVAIRSTVMPGTNEQVSRLIAQISGKRPEVDFAVVSNPEFLREATAIDDFMHPSFSLVGTRCEWAAKVLKSAYANLNAPFVVAEPRVAELMKYVCNSFHALKITFANEVGSICKKLDIDSRELMRIFCMDGKLNTSKAYLKPGFAYGGSCLPKDLKALRTIAHDHYLSCPVLESVERSNEEQKERLCREIQQLGKQNLGFLGLSFKAGTDDLRESPIVDVLERLLGKGFNVQIYDPHVHVSRLVGANRNYILQRIPYISRFITDNLQSVFKHADVVVVVNNEPGLKETLERASGSKTIIDLSNVGFGRSSGSYHGLAW